MTVDLSRFTAVELRQLLLTGELKALEVTEYFLDKIASQNHLIGAFTQLDGSALDAAAALDTVRGSAPVAIADSAAPLLWGLPIAHKELIDVAGLITTHGSRVFADQAAATEDSPLAAVTRAAGAVHLGKTQVPEFGLSGYSENRLAPPARNPHNPSLTAGGSSGGAAAAVAAGMVPFATGSDAGGSIRIPAAACGVVGLKPSRGALAVDREQTPGGADAVQLSVSGPLAQTVADAALLFDAMRADPVIAAGFRAGGSTRHAALDAVTAVQRERGAGDPGRDRDRSRLRIGVTAQSVFDGDFSIRLDAATAAALEYAAGQLAARGHSVEWVTFAYPSGYYEDFNRVWRHSFAQLPLTSEQLEQLDPYTAYSYLEGKSVNELAAARSRQRLRQIGAAVSQQWREFDAVLTPTNAWLPPEVGFFAGVDPAENFALQCQWLPYTSIANVSGVPAVSVPVLRDAESRLPVSVQLLGDFGAELRLLALATEIELPRDRHF